MLSNSFQTDHEIGSGDSSQFSN